MELKNPQAFPIAETKDTESIELGMTLRDYFANSAMQSLIPLIKSENEGQDIDLIEKHISKMSYGLADKMLKQREL